MRNPDVSETITPVWSPWHFNLGDHWATVNYLVTRSFTLREEQLLSRYQHGVDFKPRFTEILGVLDMPERSSVVITDEKGTHEPEGFDIWAGFFWATKEKWDPFKHENKICYQFDGISSADDKNPSPEDEARILSACSKHTVVRVGKDMTLEQVVHEMATSAVFIGCDSGMSHIAHSVGVPMILVEYKLPIVTTHRHKNYKTARGTNEMLQILSTLK